MTEIKAEVYLQNNLCRFLLQVDANLHVPVKKNKPGVSWSGSRQVIIKYIMFQAWLLGLYSTDQLTTEPPESVISILFCTNKSNKLKIRQNQLRKKPINWSKFSFPGIKKIAFNMLKEKYGLIVLDVWLETNGATFSAGYARSNGLGHLVSRRMVPFYFPDQHGGTEEKMYEVIK